jgi:hypothetical protein
MEWTYTEDETLAVGEGVAMRGEVTVTATVTAGMIPIAGMLGACACALTRWTAANSRMAGVVDGENFMFFFLREGGGGGFGKLSG